MKGCRIEDMIDISRSTELDLRCQQECQQENSLNGCEEFRTENGSIKGQNLALTGLFVPTSLDSGYQQVLKN